MRTKLTDFSAASTCSIIENRIIYFMRKYKLHAKRK